MLFNSYLFIGLFLPVTLLGYYILGRADSDKVPKFWLLICSFFFYSYWNVSYLGLILASVFINYISVRGMQSKDSYRKPFFLLGMFFNLGLLGFFKYYDFFLYNVNYIFSSDVGYLKLLLPLGISFFTLQQLAYLVDVYQGISKNKSFIDYALFVSFFPQLIAGPIVHHSDLIPQFAKKENLKFNTDRFSIGVFIFCLGLAKKVLIADTFAEFSNDGFGADDPLHLFWAWGASLSYTFQLYFDFSGYSDMAIGLGHMFNIRIPENFNSPLKSKNIIEFWTRWHITLSQFFTAYVFTPVVRLMPKLNFHTMVLGSFIAMLISGIWHGAGWTFILYGVMHGIAIVINHYWKKRKIKMPGWLAVFLSFNFINISFTMFRANSVEQAIQVYSGMLGFNGVTFPKGIISREFIHNAGFKLTHHMTNNENLNLLMIMLFIFVVLKTKNSMAMMKEFKPNNMTALVTAGLFVFCLFGLNRLSEFIYFNF